jgi:DNA ligase (NAD+)
MDIRINDTAIIGRAGDVIPDIIQILPQLRDSGSKKLNFPNNCPFCSTKIHIGDKIIKCPNQNCFNRQCQQFIHFTSRSCFNITGLGSAIITKLLHHHLIKDVADVFLLKKDDIIKLEGFQEKSAYNLISSIQSKKTIPFSRFIFALGIENVGEKTAQDLSQKFKNLSQLKKSSIQELEEIDNIGEKTAQSIYNWFNNSENEKLLHKFIQVGIKIIYPKRKTKNQPLKNKKIALTGVLKSMTREAAKEKIYSLGGEIISTISTKTDYLIIGENPGSKYKKAQQLNTIKILTEQQFLQLIKNEM